jgi:NAD(P)H-hydrate epimerase
MKLYRQTMCLPAKQFLLPASELEMKFAVRRFFFPSLYFTKILSFSTLLTTHIPRMNSISYIDAKTAQAIDEKLMNQNGFSIDQLMELAGYSVANAVHDYYTGRYGKENPKSNRRLLIYCGPGNNGGDGLVAARHLKHFGYLPSIIYPKQGKTQLFSNLVKQCIDLEIDILSNIPSVDEMNQAQMIVDGLFGFSFSGPLRSPFDSIIQSFTQTKTPIFSIDLPSG